VVLMKTPNRSGIFVLSEHQELEVVLRFSSTGQQVHVKHYCDVSVVEVCSEAFGCVEVLMAFRSYLLLFTAVGLILTA
jgi:hypothetical protein